jgi:hypothetical protein
MLPLLREGPEHRYYNKLLGTFLAVAKSVFEEAGCAESVAEFCLKHIVPSGSNSHVRIFFFHNLLEPLCMHCSTSVLARVLCSSADSESVASRLLQAAQNGDTEAKTFAFSTWSLAFDRLTLNTLRATVTASVFGEASTGKELTAALSKAAVVEVQRPEGYEYDCLPQ